MNCQLGSEEEKQEDTDGNYSKREVEKNLDENSDATKYLLVLAVGVGSILNIQLQLKTVTHAANRPDILSFPRRALRLKGIPNQDSCTDEIKSVFLVSISAYTIST